MPRATVQFVLLFLVPLLALSSCTDPDVDGATYPCTTDADCGGAWVCVGATPSGPGLCRAPGWKADVGEDGATGGDVANPQDGALDDVPGDVAHDADVPLAKDGTQPDVAPDADAVSDAGGGDVGSDDTVEADVADSAGDAADGDDTVSCTPGDCDDKDPCTVDTCDPQVGCSHGPIPDLCKDVDPCTTVAGCVGGKCDKFAATPTFGPVEWASGVSPNDAADVTDIALATDGKGTWLMVYTVKSLSTGTGPQIHRQLSTDGGETWSGRAPIQGGAPPGADGHPTAAWVDGGWMVAWHSGAMASMPPGRIAYARASEAAATWTVDTLVDGKEDQKIYGWPHLVAKASGAVVVYTVKGGMAPLPDEIYAQVYSSGSFGKAVKVSTGATIGALPNNTEDATLVADPSSGRVVATWRATHVPFGGDGDLVTSVSHDGGAVWTEPGLLHTSMSGLDGNDEAPGMATDRKGTWMAVWHNGTPSSPGLRWSTASATADDWTKPAIIPTPPNFPVPAGDGTFDKPALATDGTGLWVLAVSTTYPFPVLQGQVEVSSNADSDIAWMWTNNAGLSWSKVLSMSPWAADATTEKDERPALGCGGYGEWVVAWPSNHASAGGTDLDLAATWSSAVWQCDDGDPTTTDLCIRPGGCTHVPTK